MVSKGFRIGGMAIDDTTGMAIKVLSTLSLASINNGTGAPFYSGITQYQVTAGKVFHITGMIFIGSAMSAGSDFEIRSATNAALNAGVVTLATYAFSVAVSVPLLIPVGDLQCAASTYVGIWNQSGTNDLQPLSVTIIGYEADT